MPYPGFTAYADRERELAHRQPLQLTQAAKLADAGVAGVGVQKKQNVYIVHIKKQKSCNIDTVITAVRDLL